jgi:hypothetical protein
MEPYAEPMHMHTLFFSQKSMAREIIKNKIREELSSRSRLS